MVLCRCERDLYQLVNIGEEAKEFSVRACWNNHASLRRCFGECCASYRDAVVVCRCKRCLLANKRCEDASKDRSRFVASGGEDGGVERCAEGLLGHPCRYSFPSGANLREVVSGCGAKV